MFNRRYLYIVISLIVVIYALYFIFSPHGKVLAPSVSDLQKPTQGITYQNASSDLVVIDSPRPGDVVSKEFSIAGKARGQWFFEASFPIEVLDKNGGVIGSAVANAQSEWTTTDFVPFKADIAIPDSYSGIVTVVLKKDNPSDIPDKDASASFQVSI